MRTYVFGDSHAHYTFRNAPNAVPLYRISITMHRVGRDGGVINRGAVPASDVTRDTAAVVLYGEVDCRCHIGKQVALGRDERQVCEELVSRYLAVLARDFAGFGRVILPEITPTTRRAELEAMHGPIKHEFPFVGTDEERVRYTATMNAMLRTGAAARASRSWSGRRRTATTTARSTFRNPTHVGMSRTIRAPWRHWP